MTEREQYSPGRARGAQIQNDGEKWTLILVRELRHLPEKSGRRLLTRRICANGRSLRPMGASATHRWLSIAFTVAVVISIVAVVTGRYATWVGLLAVFPLAFLLFTGLYLFVLPYAINWRSVRRTGS